VEVSPNGKYVIAASDTLRIWRISAKKFRRLFWPLGKEKPSREIETISSIPEDMAVTSDGKYIFTVEDRGQYIRIYSFRKGTPIQSHKIPSARMTQITVLPDSRFVITGCKNGEIGIWPLSMHHRRIQLNF
jgi:WD40 repeat protein